MLVSVTTARTPNMHALAPVDICLKVLASSAVTSVEWSGLFALFFYPLSFTRLDHIFISPLAPLHI